MPSSDRALHHSDHVEYLVQVRDQRQTDTVCTIVTSPSAQFGAPAAAASDVTRQRFLSARISAILLNGRTWMNWKLFASKQNWSSKLLIKVFETRSDETSAFSDKCRQTLDDCFSVFSLIFGREPPIHRTRLWHLVNLSRRNNCRRCFFQIRQCKSFTAQITRSSADNWHHWSVEII